MSPSSSGSADGPAPAAGRDRLRRPRPGRGWKSTSRPSRCRRWTPGKGSSGTGSGSGRSSMRAGRWWTGRRIMAAGTRRLSSGFSSRRSTTASAPRAGLARMACSCWPPRCSSSERRSSATATCRGSPAPTTSGRRRGRSRTPAVTWQRSAARRGGPTAGGCCPGRRPGAHGQPSQTGPSGCFAATPRRRGTAG